MKADSNEEATPDNSETPAGTEAPAAPKRSSLPWLIALIAVAVAAFAGWQLMQVSQLRQAAGGMASDTTELRGEINSLEARIANLSNQTTEQAVALQNSLRISDDIVAVEQLLLAEIARLEQRVDLGVAEPSGRNADWLAAEATYLLQTANVQAGLAGNVEATMRALELADQRLAESGQARFLPVRAAIAQELVALQSLPDPDLTGVALKLQALDNQLPRLPLDRRVRELGSAERSEGESGMDRAIDSVNSAFESMFSVKRTDAPVTPQLTAAEEGLLIRGMQLELKLARLALISGDGNAYRMSIDAALTQLRRHFDLNASAVTSAIEDLETLSAIQLAPAIPDVSGSLIAMQAAMAEGSGE